MLVYSQNNMYENSDELSDFPCCFSLKTIKYYLTFIALYLIFNYLNVNLNVCEKRLPNIISFAHVDTYILKIKLGLKLLNCYKLIN